MSPIPPPSRRLDEPEAGYFLIRVVKGGPMVPAAIFHQYGLWHSEINGVQQGDANENPLYADKVCSIWNTYRERIDAAEYRRRLKLAADPNHPSSNPTQAIDLAARAPLF